MHLKDEIELVQAYVHIQQVRYNHRFDVTFACDEDILYALVPKLSLRPLVENAIIHGIAPLPEQEGLIEITVTREGPNRLAVEIKDNGVGMEQSRQVDGMRKRPGIGLSNVQELPRRYLKKRAA